MSKKNKGGSWINVHDLAREFKERGYGLKDTERLQRMLGRELSRAERRALNMADGKLKGGRITTATDVVQHSDEKLYKESKSSASEQDALPRATLVGGFETDRRKH